MIYSSLSIIVVHLIFILSFFCLLLCASLYSTICVYCRVYLRSLTVVFIRPTRDWPRCPSLMK